MYWYRTCFIIIALFTAGFSGYSQDPGMNSPDVTLGHFLFYEKKLSINSSKSCSSCHDPLLAFSDGYRSSVGVYGDPLPHNSPSLINVGSRVSLDWKKADLHLLEDQMDRPLFSLTPPELGIVNNDSLFLNKFRTDSFYKKLFREAFPHELNPISFTNIKKSISGYLLQLNSRQSAFDKYKIDPKMYPLNKDAMKGMKIFFGKKASCFICHGGQDFDKPEIGSHFANTGLYSCRELDPGEISNVKNGLAIDSLSFRIPSLRNVALTGPYYHDGSEDELLDVIGNYVRGGRNVDFGDCKGEGSVHPLKDSRMKKFRLSNNEKLELIAFLNTLTDTSYLCNKLFINPFENE